MRVEAEHTEAIVERDEDDALLGEVFTVVVWRGAAAFGVRPTEDPQHHRPPVTGAVGLRPDVEVQAVLAHRRRTGQVHGHVHGCSFGLVGLDADVAPGLRVSHAGPLRDRLRFAPAQVPGGRSPERNALEHAHTRGQCFAGNRSGVSLHRIGNRSRCCHGERGKRRGNQADSKPRFHARATSSERCWCRQSEGHAQPATR